MWIETSPIRPRRFWERRTLRDTVHASLLEVVNAKRRFELVALLGEEGRFDFESAEHSWGGDT